MTPEDAIQFADEVLLALNDKPLTDIQRMILSESLAGKRYEEMKGHSTSHIKTEGSILWELLTAALKEKIGKKSCKGVLEKRLRASGIDPKQPMLSTYNEQTWVGRETLIGDFLPKLQRQTCLLWITGISGIGKTAFGECLVNHAWKSDPSFQWIYLEILEGQSPDFTSVAAELLAKLGDSELNPQQQNNSDLLAKRLLQKLRSHRYWLQIDSLERLLDPEQPNEFVDPYWATFLQRYLTDSNIISRLVLTAQVFPRALIEFSDRYSNTWSECRLGGLLQVDRQLEFFAKRKVVIAPSNRDVLIRIATIYEGHPLVLKVIAEDIVNSFGGDVSSFWQIYQPEFEQVSRELQATRINEIEYNEALYRKVRERIRRSLERIPPEALNLLCRSAVFRRPVPKKFWLAMLGDYSLEQQRAAYQVLDDRALIEKEGIDIRQHNLIRSISYNLLKTNIVKWHQAERQAADIWLTVYEPSFNSSNLETLRGYLETFYHRYEAQDYIFLSKFLLDQLENLDRLQYWGYYQEMIWLYSKLLDRLNFAPSCTAICAIRLGNAYYFMSNYSQALKYWNEGLILAREAGNSHWEGRALGNISNIYFYQSNYKESIKINHQYLDLSRSVQDRTGEAHALGGLGASTHMLGDYAQAIVYYEQELLIRHDIKDKYWISNSLSNLGESYLKMKDYDQTIKYLQYSLRLAREGSHQYIEIRSLRSLGNAYRQTNLFQEAIDHCQAALKMAREIGNLHEEASTLHGLGLSMIKIGNFSQGEEYLIAALNIYRELGNYDDESEALLDLAHFYHREIGSLTLAMENCEQALVIATKLGIPRMHECSQLKIELLDDLRLV
jgi:tetratricopeptide (TPR) repeat protein